MPELNATVTSETPTPATESPTPVAPKAPKPKAVAKKAAVKAAPVKKATVKKTETTKTTTCKIPDQATKEIRWTDKKISFLKALKKAGALSAGDAKTKEVIAKKGNVDIKIVIHQCNPLFDLTVQKYIGTAVVEGQRQRCHFITAKGLKKLERAE